MKKLITYISLLQYSYTTKQLLCQGFYAYSAAFHVIFIVLDNFKDRILLIFTKRLFCSKKDPTPSRKMDLFYAITFSS